MAHQDLTSYLAPYTCTLPRNTAEHKAIQTKLFAAIRNEKAANATREHAKFRLLCLNIRLILKIALGVVKKSNDTVDIEDLLQVGQLALYHAMDTFDHTRGVLLISYAGLGIERAMQRSICDNVEDGAPCRIPAHRRRQLGKVRYAMGELAKKGHDPRDAKAVLAKIHARPEKTSKKMTAKDVEACLELVPQGKTTALNAPCNPHEGQSNQVVDMMPGDVDSPEQRRLDQQAQSKLLERYQRILNVLDKLSIENRKTARSVAIIRLRYGLDGDGQRTLDESGRPFDLTRERARQVIEALLKKLAEMTGMTTAAVEEALEAGAEGLVRIAA